jgi:hypothetical protein
MARAFGWLTFTTFAMLAGFVGGLKSLGWSGGALVAMAAFVVIWVLLGAGIAMTDYLAMLVILVLLTAIGIITRAVLMAADGTLGYGHLLAIAAAMVVSFAAGIGCGWRFEAEPDHQTDVGVPL